MDKPIPLPTSLTRIGPAMFPLWFMSDSDEDGLASDYDSRDLMVGAATRDEAIAHWRARWMTGDTPTNVFRVNASTPVRGALGWHGPNCQPVHDAA